MLRVVALTAHPVNKKHNKIYIVSTNHKPSIKEVIYNMLCITENYYYWIKTMKILFKAIKFNFIFATIILLFGCASGAKIENMSYQGGGKKYDDNLNKNVGVASVSGGEKTNPAWTSEISSESFSNAIKKSLSEQGLYSNNGKYQLQVKMLKIEQPFIGFNMTVTTHVKYILTDTTRGYVVLDEIIIAPHTATFGDAFVGVKRLRLANEGSGKKNIERLFEKLSELKLSPKEISVIK
jgi:hypothetical protein